MQKTYLNFYLSFLGNPLDTLIDRLGGHHKVAELTGRKSRLLRSKYTGKISYHKRSENGIRADQQNILEKGQFLNGKKRIAIISEAASSGISLHADRREKNQRRRVHITLELPWSADSAIQQLGRSHRSNQSSAPVYKLLVSRMGGENRFASAVAKKMISLGALTQGDRRSAVEGKNVSLSTFNFDSKYGKLALSTLLERIKRSLYGAVIAFPDLSEELMKETIDVMHSSEDLQNILMFRFSPQHRNTPRDSVKLDFNDWLKSHPKLSFAQASAVWLRLVGVDIEGMSPPLTVPRFLNRLLGLQCERQNLMFQAFSDVLDEIVRNAKKEGTYDVVYII